MNTVWLEGIRRNLPEQPGIMGREEYFNSVVLLLLTEVEGEPAIVFEKRHEGIRQGGEICLPGGRVDVDTDRTVEDTALRETFEELGVPAQEVHLLGRLDTVVANMGATVDVVVGWTDMTPAQMVTQPEEVAHVFTMPLSWFHEHEPQRHQVLIRMHPTWINPKTGVEEVLLPSSELGLPEAYHEPWGGFRSPVLVYPTAYGPLWGLTARIVRDFTRRVSLAESHGIRPGSGKKATGGEADAPPEGGI